MKWNEEWERGNAEQWAYGPYDDARISIEWNGKRAGGSGEVWHFEVGWAPSCGDNYTRGQHGRYCMEDQFEVRMNPGVDPYSGPGQYLFRKVSPGGSGFYWAIP